MGRSIRTRWSGETGTVKIGVITPDVYEKEAAQGPLFSMSLSFMNMSHFHMTNVG